MAACESLQQIFESTLPEKAALMEPLSPWKQSKDMEKSPSFTEIFGELHFQEDPEPSSLFPMPAPSLMDSVSGSGTKEEEEEVETKNFPEHSSSHSVNLSIPSTPKSDHSISHRKSDSFSSMNSESLQLCTEGLGFESCDELEDLRVETDENLQFREERRRRYSSSGRLCREFRRSRSMGAGAYPPPIPSISMTGKPWVCFKSYRHDGRFVLKEIRIPTQELLQASREGGRLRLHFVQPKDEVLEEEAENDEEVEEQGALEDRDGGDGREGCDL